MRGIPPGHLLIAFLVVAIWGTNFVVIREGLHSLPPLLFATLRFAFALVPAVFFFPRPAVPVSHLALFGLFTGAGQFGLLFLALDGGIAPGLASLVMQMQVFFTILLAVRFTEEKISAKQAMALSVAGCGIVLIALNIDGTTSWWGLAFTLAASFCWAAANMVAKRAPVGVNMLSYVIWSCWFSVPVLLALSLLLEGPTALGEALVNAGAGAWISVGWQSWANTLFGFSVWAWLLSRYPTSSVAPLSLLIPVVGMGTAAVWLQEPLPLWKYLSTVLILSGLGLNMLVSSRPKPSPT